MRASQFCEISQRKSSGFYCASSHRYWISFWIQCVDGADELDVVANISAIKNADWSAIADEINHIMPIIRSKNKVVKIIIESGVLTDDEIIKCCDIYGIAGIDYLKTSTGYAEKGA
ncbi:MAG: deoxyribose-phosphate aldolase, partial [Pseudomonadota bacterium]